MESKIHNYRWDFAVDIYNNSLKTAKLYRKMGLLNYLFLLSYILCLGCCATTAGPGPQLRLTSGTFVGTASNSTDRFLGVPFAQPPVDSLRFKAPVAITRPAAGILQATQFGNACPQKPAGNLGAPIAEDCLVLNVRHGAISFSLCKVVDFWHTFRSGGQMAPRVRTSCRSWYGST